jgi:hypothetical protein
MTNWLTPVVIIAASPWFRRNVGRNAHQLLGSGKILHALLIIDTIINEHIHSRRNIYAVTIV